MAQAHPHFNILTGTVTPSIPDNSSIHGKREGLTLSTLFLPSTTRIEINICNTS